MKKIIIQNLILLVIATVIFFLGDGDLEAFNKHFENTLQLENCKASTSTPSSDFKELEKIINVIDGDTVEIMQNCRLEHVRLIGINTPETVDPRRKVQCFGKEASDYAKKTLSGASVFIETDEVSGTRDKYGRLLGYIILEDQTNFNQTMIEKGYAYESTYEGQHYKYREQFKSAQTEAKSAKRGLWATNTCDGKK